MHTWSSAHLGVGAVRGDKLHEATANLRGPAPDLLGEVPGHAGVAGRDPRVHVLHPHVPDLVVPQVHHPGQLGRGVVAGGGVLGQVLAHVPGLAAADPAVRLVVVAPVALVQPPANANAE